MKAMEGKVDASDAIDERPRTGRDNLLRPKSRSQNLAPAKCWFASTQRA